MGIRDIPLPDREIIYVKESDTIATALKVLQGNNIRTVAVADDKYNQIICLVTVYDIMTFICFSAYEYDSIPDEIKACKSLDTPVGELGNIHEEGKHTWKFEDIEPISYLLDPMSLGYHQVVVCTKDVKTKLISQHDLVKYYCAHPFPEAMKTLKELGFGDPDKPFKTRCCSVDSNHTALYAFRRMEVEGYSALPVVHPVTSSIIATISSSDVRNLSPEHINDVLRPVTHFLANIHGHIDPPLVCGTDVTLLAVMNRMIGTHHRHTWVVDDKGRHVDTVSLSDIIGFPSRHVVVNNTKLFDR